ncbi:YdeI/OmpD-associated family protein [Fictibacillus nanhaiensis]|uniref:YdeI/OmpD-associated family protein n=1 Tax=Fictibacillus nanhaiensis TaxID=742169 RepID=UPI001C94F6CA|nr:YdeI/OmpD-associated family protein [Fictibacillus nanhaiensis]MBY6037644.1 YdeI/OmpD-associated family protein [Fictibacillus nanhaiensis]
MNSTKSVVDKLNLTKYNSKLILNKPDDIEDFTGLDYDSSIQKEKYDLIFVFVFNLEELSKHLHLVIEKQLVHDKGYIFFAYPKKNNSQYKEYIERDQIFPYINVDEDGYVPESSLKFSRMISLNDIFTVIGLKMEKKKATASVKKSQCVDDYIVHVDDIKRYLMKNEEVLNLYKGLTFGYQKDWARYVYSAKRKETQEKRLLEMEDILGEGYKSMDLYRRKKK